jgi:DNA-binding MltR family transcriptional regulator
LFSIIRVRVCRKTLIKDISKISDLPAETIEEYRQYGWTDEEIVENFNDAINFLNSNLETVEKAQMFPFWRTYI